MKINNIFEYWAFKTSLATPKNKKYGDCKISKVNKSYEKLLEELRKMKGSGT